jgi:hypothetical protein
MGVADRDSDAIIVTVIGIGLVGRSWDAQSTVLVNSKATSWNELGNTLRDQLQVRPHWIVYVTAEDGTSWSEVAKAIDIARGLRAEVVLLTAKPGTDLRPKSSSEESPGRRKK